MEYLYDDCGVICRKNPEDETDIQPVEPHCLNCGFPTDDCECGDYEAGWYFEEGEEDEDSDEEDEGLREKIDSGISINPHSIYSQTATQTAER